MVARSLLSTHSLLSILTPQSLSVYLYLTGSESLGSSLFIHALTLLCTLTHSVYIYLPCSLAHTHLMHALTHSHALMLTSCCSLAVVPYYFFGIADNDMNHLGSPPTASVRTSSVSWSPGANLSSKQCIEQHLQMYLIIFICIFVYIYIYIHIYLSTCIFMHTAKLMYIKDHPRDQQNGVLIHR